MTDEQIVKAFKICLSPHLGCEDGCPFIGMCQKDNGTLYRAIIDLIKRQQAEIDHLRKATKKVKSDLKYYLDTNEENGVVWIPKFTINNLVKEMTDQKGGAE